MTNIVMFILVGVALFFMIMYIIGSANYSAKIPENLRYFSVYKKGKYLNIYPKDPVIYGHIEFYIAGVQYRKDIDNYLGEFRGNLVPEPRNKHDRNAIKIVALDGHHVGYVPKDRTAEIKSKKKFPCPCYCFITKYRGRYITSCWIESVL